MAHPLGIIAHRSILRGWEKKQQEHGLRNMLVCASLSLLLCGVVPRAQILSHFFLSVVKVTLNGMWRTWDYWQCLEDKNQEDLVEDVRPADKEPVKRSGALRWCMWLRCGPRYGMGDLWGGTDSLENKAAVIVPIFSGTGASGPWWASTVSLPRALTAYAWGLPLPHSRAIHHGLIWG